MIWVAINICFVEIIKFMLKILTSEIMTTVIGTSEISLKILNGILEIVLARWEMVFCFCAWKIASQINEILSHGINVSMEMARLRSSCTNTNLAALTKTVAYKICHVERQAQMKMGRSADLW